MPPSQSERRFEGASAEVDDDAHFAYVEVTERTQTEVDALAALVEVAAHDWPAEIDDDLIADRVKPEPERCWYKLGGDGDVPCEPDDPDKLGEYWIFDISKAWRGYAA